MCPSDDLSRSFAPFICDATAIAVVELNQKTWLEVARRTEASTGLRWGRAGGHTSFQGVHGLWDLG